MLCWFLVVDSAGVDVAVSALGPATATWLANDIQIPGVEVFTV